MRVRKAFPGNPRSLEQGSVNRVIPEKYNWLAVNLGWIAFLGYLVFLCIKVFRNARRQRDERKMREALLSKKK